MNRTRREITGLNFMVLVCLLFLTGAAPGMAQGRLPQPNTPANKIPVPTKLPPQPKPTGEWRYTMARTAASVLNTINGGSTNQTIRDPYISASVKNGQPLYHIFFHPKYNGNTPWKWKAKQIDKLNEVVDFLGYKNSFKNEPLHTQAKVVPVTIGSQTVFYIFYVTNDEATSFNKPAWQGFFTNTANNVLSGVNQSGSGSNGIPVADFELGGTDNGFYYFLNPQSKGPGTWGWARAETPEGALNFLNTKYTNQPVTNASIAAVQEPAQIVFYVFYR